MKKVIITGVTGFIGGQLAKEFLKRGYVVYGLGRNRRLLDRMKENANFYGINADYRNYDNIVDCLPSGTDIFINTANVGSLQGADLQNIDMQIENIRCACAACSLALKKGAKKYVQISSSYKYMIDNFKNYASLYGRTKSAIEDYCQLILKNSKTQYNVAILTNTFGYGDYSKKAVNFFVESMILGKELKLIDGENLNDWVYIDDTVNGIIAISELGINGKKYYIGHKNISTFKQKLIDMKNILCSKSTLCFGEYEDNTYIDYTKLSPDELYEDTKFKCNCDFKESIIKTAKWIKELEGFY